jgi:hypothetical protein
MNACFKGSRANADPDKPKSVVRIVIFERATEPRRRCESQLHGTPSGPALKSFYG